MKDNESRMAEENSSAGNDGNMTPNDSAGNNGNMTPNDSAGNNGMMSTDSVSEGKPQASQDKRKMTMPQIIAAAVIIGIVVGVVSGAVRFFVGRLLEDRHATVLKAAHNTFLAEDSFAGALMGERLFGGDEFTFGLKLELPDSDTGVNLDYMYGKDKRQLSGALEAMSMSVDCLAQLDADELRLSIPMLFDKTFAYNYTDKNACYVIDLLNTYVDPEAGETLNSVLSTIYETEPAGLNSPDEETKAALKDWFYSTEIERVGRVEFETAEKTVRARRYTFAADGEKITELGRLLTAALEKTGYSGIEELKELEAGAGEKYLSKEESRIFDIYIDDDRIVGVTVKDEEEKELLRLTVDSSDANEIYTFLSGTDTVRIICDPASCSCQLTADFASVPVGELVGDISENSELAESGIDGLLYGAQSAEAEEVKLELTLKKGVDFRELPGEVTDVSTLTEADIQEMIMNVFGKLMTLFG